MTWRDLCLINYIDHENGKVGGGRGAGGGAEAGDECQKIKRSDGKAGILIHISPGPQDVI